ncbi:MAG TPA: DUF4173 domain-containing protein [Saprospiraceae bacterium]|nr:DUF4173 domain-containing protein [Saprospiraceae bacterium]HMQ81681.1 DUF4173 domain-containing protein [Saprospiraceae bacterium]
MKKELLLTFISLIGALLYCWLFWSEGMGLNTLIFAAISLGLTWWQWPECRSQWLSKWIMAALLLSAIWVVWHHSFLARTTHLIFFTLMIGILQKEAIRFLVFGFILGFIGLFESPFRRMAILLDLLPGLRMVQVIKRSQLALYSLPLGIGLLFGFLYYQANTGFAKALDWIWQLLGRPFNWGWDIGQFMTFLLGFMLLSALLSSSALSWRVHQLEDKLPKFLIRQRKKRSMGNTLALKHEYRMGFITFAILNGLLFFANMADLRYVWMNYGGASPQELSQYVHAGTYLLILSILLAQGVILWFFRGNLNFYPAQEGLHSMAYVWLAQNAMLALSVGLRNWQYVMHYGLAYKRLGVFWFLALVLLGLFLLYRKVEYKFSLFHLLKQNSAVFFSSLLLLSAINWDVLITKYNIRQHTQTTIDAHFLYHWVSDKNLYLLDQHFHLLAAKSNMSAPDLQDALTDKYQRFERRLASRTWRSWNWADEKNRRYFAKNRN